MVLLKMNICELYLPLMCLYVQEMETAIQKKISEEREKFRSLVDQRMDTIERTINTYIPPEISDQERKAIKEETKMQYEEAKVYMSSDLNAEDFL
mgnify:CR=1 FL=1